MVNSTQLRVNSAIPKASHLRTYVQHGSIVATAFPEGSSHNNRWDVQNKDPIIGYIPNVSVLNESRNKLTYFNFNIQTESDFLQGVCCELYYLRDIS